MLDGEVDRRKPAQRSHRKVVGALVVNGELFSKVIQGIKGVRIVEALLIFPVAAFDLAVVPGSIGALVSFCEVVARNFNFNT